MASLITDSDCDAVIPGGADAVARGVVRMFARHRVVLQREVSLRNGRRADLMGYSDKGEITIIEIKCSRADLCGDRKWPEYLDYCDRFYWALPPALDAGLVDGEAFLPARTGLIVADAYDAGIVRPAARHALASARRKVEIQRLGFLAMQRLSRLADPELANIDAGSGD